ncbi:MAG: hypothetical protein JWL81_2383 [Verrucomicrobiales bacterium]|nr:hypothetical protein [Verrucomicrobiales bacterium]
MGAGSEAVMGMGMEGRGWKVKGGVKPGSKSNPRPGSGWIMTKPGLVMNMWSQGSIQANDVRIEAVLRTEAEAGSGAEAGEVEGEREVAEAGAMEVAGSEDLTEAASGPESGVEFEFWFWFWFGVGTIFSNRCGMKVVLEKVDSAGTGRGPGSGDWAGWPGWAEGESVAPGFDVEGVFDREVRGSLAAWRLGWEPDHLPAGDTGFSGTIGVGSAAIGAGGGTGGGAEGSGSQVDGGVESQGSSRAAKEVRVDIHPVIRWLTGMGFTSFPISVGCGSLGCLGGRRVCYG